MASVISDGGLVLQPTTIHHQASAPERAGGTAMSAPMSDTREIALGADAPQGHYLSTDAVNRITWAYGPNAAVAADEVFRSATVNGATYEYFRDGLGRRPYGFPEGFGDHTVCFTSCANDLNVDPFKRQSVPNDTACL